MQPRPFSKKLTAIALMLMKKRKMLLWVLKRSVCDHSSPICPHKIFLSIHCYYTSYVIWSYNSSHLRTNSINFSSISEDNQAGLIATKHSKRRGDGVITAHMIRNEHVGPVPSRPTFSLGGNDGTELRCDWDVPLSVNISV